MITTPPRAELARQLREIQGNGLLAMIQKATQANGIELAMGVAVASRETNCKNILGDPQPDGRHGVGIMQRDIQHADARAARDNGTWSTPEGTQALIDANVAELASNRAVAQSRLEGWQAAMTVAFAGYNCGITRAIADGLDGNADRRTTGANYGSDCFARYQVFADLIACPP